MKNLRKYFLVLGLAVFMIFNCGYVLASYNLEIIYEDGLLTVSADGAMPENIFMELGKECNIDIIAHGEVFPQKEVTIKLKDMAIKEAIKRLVRVCALKNYLMDFKKGPEGKSRLAKIDLYMGGSGQRVLTTGREVPAKKTAARKSNKKPVKSPASSGKKDKIEWPAKSSFVKDSDFQWDGSAPIAFPEYEGELAFDESWEDEAKNFADGTMDLVPPGGRDQVAELIPKMCNQIKNERGVDTITSEIMAEALQRIAKQANLPPNVIRNIPETPSDLEKEKIPISQDQLSGE